MLHATTWKAWVTKETHNTTTYERHGIRNLHNIDTNNNNNNNDNDNNSDIDNNNDNNNTLVYWLEDTILEVSFIWLVDILMIDDSIFEHT